MSDTGKLALVAGEAPQKAEKQSYKYKRLKAACGTSVL